MNSATFLYKRAACDKNNDEVKEEWPFNKPLDPTTKQSQGGRSFVDDENKNRRIV